ncbi:MAG: GLPGLI family protein [Bacteroidetes bacterium]|nr:MAG: GLPGLI family protein [Bacteroidota bacterium]
MSTFKWIVICSFLFAGVDFGNAQITSGKITFERRTNLLKKYDNRRRGRFITEKDKYQIDVFNLYFNDTLSVFIPDEDAQQDHRSWMTTRNQVVQNLSTGERTSIISVWGEEVSILDSLVERKWKITDKRRKIGKYFCTKAMFEYNDTTRIYAWYCSDIVPSIGPETFRGLPGAILGLATEDGGVVYFAKELEVMEPRMKKLIPKASKKKYSQDEFIKLIEERFGDSPRGARMVSELLMW